MPTNTTRSLTTTLILSLVFSVVSSVLFWPQVGEAAKTKSATWSKTFVKDIYYASTDGKENKIYMWLLGLRDPNVSIKYYAKVYNIDTDRYVADGDTISVGTRLRFEPVEHKDTDISWNGTGYTTDTPYGHWVENAGPPARQNCLQSDYLNERYNPSAGRITVHVPLNIDPPEVSVDVSNSTAGLEHLGGNRYRVTSSGQVRPRFVFGSTDGKFYYRYRLLNPGSVDVQANSDGCVANDYPMRTMPRESGWFLPSDGTTFVLNAPQRTISFNLTAVDPNNPPNPPTINGSLSGTTELVPGQRNDFAFKANDPDGDQIRYLIDWNMDGLVDIRLPSVSEGTWINSGTKLTAKNPEWDTVGTYTFQARTRDQNGLDSAWTTHTVIVKEDVTTTPLTVSCSGDTDPATVGVEMNWNASATGGSGAYTYSWSGNGIVAGTPGDSVPVTYSSVGSTGIKAVSVEVSDGVTTNVASCYVNIEEVSVVTEPLTAVSCLASPSSAEENTTVWWYGSKTGGTSPFTYSWTGDSGLSDDTKNTSHTYIYDAANPSRDATFSVTDALGTTLTDTCSVEITEAPTPAPGSAEPTITAEPPLVRKGESTEITWEINLNTSCTLSPNLVAELSKTGDDFLSADHVSIPVYGRTEFWIDCVGWPRAEVTVQVLPSVEEN